MIFRISAFSTVLCATVWTATCVAQSYTDWRVVPSGTSGGLYEGDTYAVDLNNDGVPDLVTNEVYDYGRLQPYFGVFISNGDGTFQSPVRYAYSPASIPPGNTAAYNLPLAFGDFNGDGNIDLAVPVSNHTIAVYLGRGDGTFVDPWYSVIDLPSNQYIVTSPFPTSGHPTMVASDFNHDGHVDLAVVGANTDRSGQTVYVLPGQGNGLFSSAIPVLNYATDINGGVSELLTGDFDYDTNADLAVEVTADTPNGGNIASSTVHVLYGDGNFGFADTIPITQSGFLEQLNAGDLNGDGKSDLYSIKSGIQTWYGQWDRTFAGYVQALPPANYISSLQPMADFNNDGLKDFVVAANGSFLVFLLATPNPGQFDVQTWNVPQYLHGGDGYSMPVAGNFRKNDEKPDFAYVGMTGPASYSIYASIPYVGLNATIGQLWANCDYPAASRGINLCSPALQSDSTVNFNATAHSFGNLRKIELWVDGSKLGEQYNTWEGNGYFNMSTSLGAGTHQGTYFAVDTDNSLQQFDFPFTIPGNCSPPNSPGVNICGPADGVTINWHSILVQASSTVTGTLARMEIWVDAEKKYTETNSNSLSATVMASPGTHQITIFAVNTDGTVWSQAASVTIQ